MLFFKEELNLVCTECNGYMKKTVYCPQCTSPFHPHCLTNLCKQCSPAQKPTTQPKINYNYHLKKYKRFIKRPFKESVVHFPNKKCHSCTKEAFYFYQKYFCLGCFTKVSKNEFCPVCFMVYNKNDFSIKMVCCDFCNRWIHLKCTTIKEKDYEAMDDQDYCCTICISNINRFNSFVKKESEVCFVCKVGYLNEDPLLVLYPYKGKYKHLNCNELTDPCVICKESAPSSVKCTKCTDSFHFLCSSGLFRQDKFISMCNLHFKPLDYKKEAYKMLKKAFKEEKGSLEEEMSFYAKGIIYKKNEFIKLIFNPKKPKKIKPIGKIKSDREISYLSFNGYSFYLDSVKKSVDDLVLLGIKVYGDPFRINCKEFLVVRRDINNEFIKKLCLLTKNDKYFFGEE